MRAIILFPPVQVSVKGAKFEDVQEIVDVVLVELQKGVDVNDAKVLMDVMKAELVKKVATAT